MVSESLRQLFNLLTGFYSSLALPSGFRLGDVIFGSWNASKQSIFFEDDSTDLCEIFFSGFW